ncbi:hypothetical protein EI94DRAFT_900246 [Lactarius quietus]|nr:hypothetical protein EI94DRAFT_900246 [Lactarius quietus]
MEESAYPVCSVADHIHDDTDSTTFARTNPHDNATLPPTSLASPDASSLSASDLLRVDTSLTTLLSPDNHIHVPGSLHTAHQTAIENIRIPATSRGSVTAGVIQDGIDISTTTVALSTTEMPSSIPPLDVSARKIGDRSTSSNVLDVPSLPSSTSVILPTGPLLSSDSHVTIFDHASSTPGSHSPMLVHPHSCSPQLTSAPDLGAIVGGEGGAIAVFRNEEDAQNSLSALRQVMIDVPNVLPRSPPPPSDNGTTIVGPSRRSLDAENMRGSSSPFAWPVRYRVTHPSLVYNLSLLTLII